MSQLPSPSASCAPLSLLSERLLELVPQIVWLADDCGNLVRLNSIWQRHTGITPTSALGEKFWRFFHFDDRHALEAAWENGVALQESWQQHGRLQMAGGSYEWFEVMVQPVTTSTASDGTGSDDVRWLGTISRLASGMNDPQLLNGQEFLEALCENVSEGLVACNSVGQLVLFNRSAQEFHGLPPEPMNPDRWSQFYDLYNTTGEQPLATQDVPLMRALTGEKVRGAEMMIKPKGRQSRSIVTNADPIVDAMGRQLGAVALMRDITVQKQLEAELITSKLTLVAQVAERTAQLAEREAQFRSTFDQSAIGCAHVGLDGYWLRMNQKLCEIVGYTHEDLLQKTFQQITHPDDLAEDLTYVERLLAGAISHYFLEKRYIRNDGAIVWVRITVSLQRQISELPDQRGEPLYFISMVEDIGDRKQLEIQDAANRRALEHARQVLEERNQELDQFVHVASHDLKAPLRGIANLSEWLEEDLAEKMSSDNREQLALMRTRVRPTESQSVFE
jgi:PAS domain S-box-containing protein